MAFMLGLRRRPGSLTLAVFRIPEPMYRWGLGWIFRHAFLLVAHRGRSSGRVHRTALKVLTYDRRTREAIVFSAWGDDAGWVKNLRASPAVEVQIGRERYVPVQRFLTEDEAFAVVVEYRRLHRAKLRGLARLMGWRGLDTNAGVREFVRTRPFLSLRPREVHTKE